MRLKALAEIYTVHCFAQFGIEVEKNPEKTPRGPQKPYETDGEKEVRKQKPAETEEDLLGTSAKRGCG